MNTVNLTRPAVTLRLSRGGVILSGTATDQHRVESFTAWQGRLWHETVTAAGVATIRRLVDEALASGVSGFGPVHQKVPSGAEIPLEYTAVSLGDQGELVAIGRRFHVVAETEARLLARQREMETTHWRLRDAETRHDMVFNAAPDPMLLLDADTAAILQVNPAATRALGVIPGATFLDLLPDASRQSFAEMLRQVRQHGHAPGVIVTIGAEPGPAPSSERSSGRLSWIVRTSLIETGLAPSLLLHLTPALHRADEQPDRALHNGLIARLPDGFIIIDGEGVVRQANTAFLDMVEAGSEAVVVGQRLERWMKRGAEDQAAILDLTGQHGTLIRLPVVLQGEFGAEIMVELSASTFGGMIGLLVRDRPRDHRPQADAAAGPLQRALQSLSWSVGATSVHAAVEETVALVERHFISTALSQVAGNRKAAAALIGLSRQSLYLKMHRYGLE